MRPCNPPFCRPMLKKADRTFSRTRTHTPFPADQVTKAKRAQKCTKGLVFDWKNTFGSFLVQLFTLQLHACLALELAQRQSKTPKSASSSHYRTALTTTKHEPLPASKLPLRKLHSHLQCDNRRKDLRFLPSFRRLHRINLTYLLISAVLQVLSSRGTALSSAAPTYIQRLSRWKETDNITTGSRLSESPQWLLR